MSLYHQLYLAVKDKYCEKSGTWCTNKAVEIWNELKQNYKHNELSRQTQIRIKQLKDKKATKKASIRHFFAKVYFFLFKTNTFTFTLYFFLE